MVKTVCTLVGLLGITLIAAAQTVQIKTVPILASDQFNLVPSFRQDMGHVSIAVPDSIQDPFINPGKAWTTRSSWFLCIKREGWRFNQETAYRQNSNARYTSSEESSSSAALLSVPVGGYFTGQWIYGGGMVALQQISNVNTSKDNFKAANVPITLFGGLRLPGSDLAVGAGVSHIRINGVDGVYLLYPNATRLRQHGHASQYRLGLSKRWGDRRLYSLSGMRYLYRLTQSTNDVTNQDEHQGWLLQTDYIHTVTPGWSVAGLLTADWRYHPKIPEYPLANIPRDPGHTQALQIGLGCKWQNSSTLLGIDLIYEPIDVKTWAEAATEITTWDKQVYHKGDKTMRNDYQFRNRLLRSGMQYRISRTVQLASGAQIRFYEYDYYQNDFINRSETTAKPQRAWTETTWSGGLTLHLAHVNLTYNVRLLSGTGLLERQWLWRWFGEVDFAKADFIIPPTVQLNVTPVTYVTQWLGVSWTF